MTKLDRLMALKKKESALQVPIGKGDNKMLTLLDLVLDLRVDNEQLRQENAYLRQLLEELERNPNLVHSWFDEASKVNVNVEVAKPHTQPHGEWDQHDEADSQADSQVVEDELQMDWEALYFETKPSAKSQNGSNGHSRHVSAVVQSRSAPTKEPQPDSPVTTTIEAVTMEQLMSDIADYQQQHPTPLPTLSDPDDTEEAETDRPRGDSSFEAILRDPVTGRRLAEVSLEGPLITSRDLAGHQRRVWGFRLVHGNLRSEWRRGKHLYLCLKNGTAVRVRIAGHPSDASNNGFVELV